MAAPNQAPTLGIDSGLQHTDPAGQYPGSGKAKTQKGYDGRSTTCPGDVKGLKTPETENCSTEGIAEATIVTRALSLGTMQS